MTEILFLTHNRRAYAEASLDALFENTPSGLIEKLWFFDDRSEDGTLELIQDAAGSLLVPGEVRRGAWNSPVDAMAEFFQAATGEFVAKIDSDVMAPPGWLDDCERLLAENPEIDLVGIEARGQSSAESAPAGAPRFASPSPWVGGIFVGRRARIVEAMRRRPLFCDRTLGKWFGWQPFQEQAPLRVAWIRPSLQVFLLDRMALEPWASLSDEYVRQGWQRPAPYRYGPEWAGLWGWWNA
jgi:glycosyltransferase involved in cell wall biosynthesis